MRAGLRRRLWLGLFLGAYAVLSVLLFDPKLSTGGDNAVYLILGQAIAQGKGYVNAHLPGEPKHTQYPPGFPLLIAAVDLLAGGARVIGAKLLVLLSGLGAAFFFFRISEGLLKREAWQAAVLFLLTPALVEYSHWILTEMPFTFLALGALHFLLKAQDGEAGWYVPAFGFTVLALYVRTAGIALVLAIALSLLVRKQYKCLALFGAAFAAAYVPWVVRNVAVSSGTPYVQQLLARYPYEPELGMVGLVDLVTRAWANGKAYLLAVLPQTMLSVFRHDLAARLLGPVLAGLMAVGLGTRLRRLTAVETYALASVPVLLLWPEVWTSERFLVPVLPVLLILLVVGLNWLGAAVCFKRLGLVVVTALLAANGLVLGRRVVAEIPRTLRYLDGDPYAGYPPDWRAFFDLLSGMERRIPADAVVLARKPEFVYLLTGRKSVGYPLTRDDVLVRRAIASCDYVLVDDFAWTRTTRRFLDPVLHGEPGRYEVVAWTQGPRFVLLKTGTQDDQGRAVCQTGDGGYAVAGFTNAQVGNYDFCLIRTGSDGSKLWARTLGGEREDRAYGILPCEDGGFVLGGHSSSLGPGDQSLLLVKTDSLGQPEWHRALGSDGYTCGYALVRSSDGCVVAAGYTRASNQHNTDLYLAMVDLKGNELWSRTYRGPRWEQCYGLAGCSDGGFLLVGNCYQPGSATDLLLLRVDSQGRPVWVRAYDTGGCEEAFDAVQTSDGGFAVVGRTDSKSAGGYDIWLVKTEPDGDTLWTRTYGSEDHDAGRSVLELEGGGYVIAGYDGLAGYYAPNLVLLETNGKGDCTSYKIYGQPGTAAGYDICRGPDGGYAVAGITSALRMRGADANLLLVSPSK